VKTLVETLLIAAASGKRDREHKFDREVIAAVHRRQRAKAGKGYQFRIPSKARR
jgi:hypothetical protein